MKHTTNRPFDIYAPGTKESPPEFLQTIEVEVETRTGQDFLTPESRRRIEDIRARHMGLMSGEDIKALRKRLKLTQKELTERLKCGEKMVSYWENGHGFPTGPANILLRLMDEDFLAPASLEAGQGPRPEKRWIEMVQSRPTHRKQPLRYHGTNEHARPSSLTVGQKNPELVLCP